MEAPELADFFDFAIGKVDVVKFSLAELEFEDRERIVSDIEVNVMRPFKRRKTYVRRDPTMSFWYLLREEKHMPEGIQRCRSGGRTM